MLLLFGICGSLVPPATAQQRGSLPDTSVAAPASGNEWKSKTRARLVSVGAMSATVGAGLLMVQTAARRGGSRWPGIYMASGGVLVAPSAGLFYAGAPGRALRGIGIRVGIGLGAAGLTAIVASGVESGSGPQKGVSEAPGPGLGVLAAGVALGTGGIVAHAVVDALDNSARAVEKHNEAIRAERTSKGQASVSVGPWVSPHDGRPGLRVHVSL